MERSFKTASATLPEMTRLASEGRLWAIVDACNAPDVPPKIDELRPSAAACLYRIRREDERWDVAPFLVAVTPPTLAWIAETLWARPWGIFVVAQSDLRTLRTHFRTLLVVRDSAGQKLFFRYYDPRVLNAFLPTCLPAELRQIFGPCTSLGIVDAASSRVTLVTELETRSPLTGPIAIASSGRRFP